MEPKPSRVVRFGVFEVDLAARELRKRGVGVRLQDQPFRVLEALLEKPGEIVTREELKERLWAQDEFVEFDKSLNTAVQKIRQALGDSAESPRFLETVPRVGYRFVAPATGLEEPLPPPEPPPREHALPRSVLLAGLGVALLLGFLLGQAFQSDEGPARSAELRKFTLTPDLSAGQWGVRFPSPSPDGQMVAFWVRGPSPSTHQLVLWEAVQDKYRPIGQVAGRPFWAPDSSRLGVAKPDGIHVIAPDNGSERMLTAWPDRPGWFTRGGSWSPDGESIVFSAGPSYVGLRLYRLPAEGGSYELLFEPSKEEVEQGLGFFDPSFLPSVGDRQALLYAEGVPFAANIGVVDLSTGERGTIVSGDASFNLPQYCSTGHVLYWETSDRLWALPFSIERLEATGEPFVVAEAAGELGVSAEGTLVYGKADGDAWMQLAWRNRQGTSVGRIGEPQQEIAMPVLSPDGRQVVVLGVEDGIRDIWIHEVDRPVKRRITFDESHNDRPTWHPSGESVSFSAGVVGRSDIWMAAADGRGEPRLLFESPASDFGFEWSPDGRYLLGSGSHFLFYLRKPDGQDAWEKVILEDDRFDHVAPDLSPDGRYLAYQSDRSGRAEIYVRPFPDGDKIWQISAGGGMQPRWQSDSEIFFVQGDTLMAAPVKTDPEFEHGRAERLFAGNGVFRGRGQRYDVTPDGQRFVVVEGTDSSEPRQFQVVENWYEEFRDRDSE